MSELLRMGANPLSKEARQLIDWTKIEDATVGVRHASGRSSSVKIPTRRQVEHAFNVFENTIKGIIEPLRRKMLLYWVTIGSVLIIGIGILYASRVFLLVFLSKGPITEIILAGGFTPIFLLFKRLLKITYDLGRIPATVAKYRLALSLATEGEQFQKHLDAMLDEVETMREIK